MNLISTSQITREQAREWFRRAADFREKKREGILPQLLAGKTMAALFYEPSSRTFGSFISAFSQLGGGTIPLLGLDHTSMVKGETFEDTIATFSRLADIVVLRHPEQGAAARAAQVSRVPVINAGDGANEHPTQALIDVYTMWERFPNLADLKITIVGDLKYGRTVHSLVTMLRLFNVADIQFVAPAELALPGEKTVESFEASLPNTDVLYMTRVQKERFRDQELYERLKNRFRLTTQTLSLMKPTAMILHPFPRVGEIDSNIDADPRASYFTQIENGVYIRMAVLAGLVGV